MRKKNKELTPVGFDKPKKVCLMCKRTANFVDSNQIYVCSKLCYNRYIGFFNAFI